MQDKTITLRCTDGQEACVFHKYTYSYNDQADYEMVFEDSYVGGDYRGFFGRIKRAWKAFWAKPVCYTGIQCENKESMRKFLQDCLDLMEEE